MATCSAEGVCFAGVSCWGCGGVGEEPCEGGSLGLNGTRGCWDAAFSACASQNVVSSRSSVGDKHWDSKCDSTHTWTKALVDTNIVQLRG